MSCRLMEHLHGSRMDVSDAPAAFSVLFLSFSEYNVVSGRPDTTVSPQFTGKRRVVFRINALPSVTTAATREVGVPAEQLLSPTSPFL